VKRTPAKRTRANQFKSSNMTSKEVIDFLFQIGSSNVKLDSSTMPDDFNSTQAIDSFLEAITFIA